MNAKAAEWHPVQLAEPNTAVKAADNSGVAAISRDYEHMDVFWVGNDGWVYVASWSADAPWKQPERVTNSGGAAKGAGVAALSRFPSHREVWWVAESDGSIQGAYWYDGYTEWERFTVPGSQGASKTAGLAALSRRADHMEVWWINQSGSVWHSWFSESLPLGHKWVEQPVQVPKATNASTVGGIAVVSRVETDIDVWWLGNNAVQHSGYTERGDKGWDTKPEPLPNSGGAAATSSLAALSRSGDHMEVWWVDTNAVVQHSWWTTAKDWVQRPEPVPQATDASTTGGIAVISRSSTDMDVWWVDKNGNVRGSWWTTDGSWAKQPYLIPGALNVSKTAGIAALSRSGDHMEVWWIGPQGSVQGAWSLDSTTSPPPSEKALDNSVRQVLKATHVLFDKAAPGIYPDADDQTDGLTKLAAIRQLNLMPGEIDQIRRVAGSKSRTKQPMSAATLKLLESVEGTTDQWPQPDVAAVTEIHSSELVAVAESLVAVRTSQLHRALDPKAHQSEQEINTAAVMLNVASVAVRQLQQTSPVGMLNLERIEMAPAGIERGELVATIPLAPGEETAVTHKEWSVTSNEFTTIVTDELEQISETGVTDNTDLAQSTSSQTQHSNQFNITGTVQGGIPVISGSTTASFTDQNSKSTSASDSIKHSRTLTEKASSRSRREHKVTVSTKTETGTQETSTRIIKNTEKHPIRIDYFSLMRRWRVRLYRYGLRLTYDVIVPEPAAGLRRTYAQLAALRAKQAPFTFTHTRSEMDELGRVVAGEWQHDHAGTMRKAEYLADKYGVSLPRPYPSPPVMAPINQTGSAGNEWSYRSLEFDVPEGARIAELRVSLKIERHQDAGSNQVQCEILGSTFRAEGTDAGQNHMTRTNELVGAVGNTKFLADQTGKQSIVVWMIHAKNPWIGLNVILAHQPQFIEKWRNDVWTAIRDGAHERYQQEQQDVAADIAELEERLLNVDTLTLRRQENDEIMKSVLRWMLPEFGYLPPAVLTALRNLLGYTSMTDEQFNKLMAPGTIFDDFTFSATQETAWSTVSTHRDKIRFINQAIEWENVVTYLYSYFWDVPSSWTTIRELRHPDSTRQAFLRAGAARVVLTVRKGWEKRWMAFAKDLRIPDTNPDDSTFPIAKEIAAYDDRHYPGIPPANPGRSAVRLQEAVYTTCSTKIRAGATKIPVASSRGFVVGLKVVLDSVEGKAQEDVEVTAIPNSKELSVTSVAHDHDGTQTPFAVLLPGEKGSLIAEWNEYTPSSGTDIAVTVNPTATS